MDAIEVEAFSFLQQIVQHIYFEAHRQGLQPLSLGVINCCTILPPGGAGVELFLSDTGHEASAQHSSLANLRQAARGSQLYVTPHPPWGEGGGNPNIHNLLVAGEALPCENNSQIVLNISAENFLRAFHSRGGGINNTVPSGRRKCWATLLWSFCWTDTRFYVIRRIFMICSDRLGRKLHSHLTCLLRNVDSKSDHEDSTN